MLYKLIKKFLGAYVPLTKEGNIIVDGVLASCYGSYDHDLIHLSVTPLRWFTREVEWMFGGYEQNGFSVFINIADSLASVISPSLYVYLKSY